MEPLPIMLSSGNIGGGKSLISSLGEMVWLEKLLLKMFVLFFEALGVSWLMSASDEFGELLLDGLGVESSEKEIISSILAGVWRFCFTLGRLLLVFSWLSFFTASLELVLVGRDVWWCTLSLLFPFFTLSTMGVKLDI